MAIEPLHCPQLDGKRNFYKKITWWYAYTSYSIVMDINLIYPFYVALCKVDLMHALYMYDMVFLIRKFTRRHTCDTRRCCTSLMCSSMLVTVDSTRFATTHHSTSVQLGYRSFLKWKSRSYFEQQAALLDVKPASVKTTTHHPHLSWTHHLPQHLSKMHPHHQPSS